MNLNTLAELCTDSDYSEQYWREPEPGTALTQARIPIEINGKRMDGFYLAVLESPSSVGWALEIQREGDWKILDHVKIYDNLRESTAIPFAIRELFVARASFLMWQSGKRAQNTALKRFIAEFHTPPGVDPDDGELHSYSVQVRYIIKLDLTL